MYNMNFMFDSIRYHSYKDRTITNSIDLSDFNEEKI